MATTDNKLLNGEGLSHLSTKVKEYVEEHGGGGGSLPSYPTDDGNYSLTLAMVDGHGTLAWSSISGVWQLPLQTLNDLQLFQAVRINKVNNNLEVV